MDRRMGHVAEIWRHPVKSFQGEQVDAIELRSYGVADDRTYGVRDGLTGRVMSAKRDPQLLQAAARVVDGAVVVTMPSGEQHAVDDPALSSALSEWLARPVVVVSAAETRPSGEPFLDGRPVHLLTTASLAASEQVHPDGAWVTRRFRPNLLIEAAGTGFVEDTWVGSAIDVGIVTLDLTMRTVRCPMTSAAQPGLDHDPAVLATTSQISERRLGVYADVLGPGRVEVGAAVLLR